MSYSNGKGGDKKSAIELYSVDSDLRFGPSTLLAGPSLLRKWLHINDNGKAATVEVDKHRLVQDLNVRYRDLLTLDPTVPTPYPASLLIREKALVVNLETVRLIICANQCYVLSVPKEGDPRVATAPSPDNPFVQQLCHVLRVASESRAGLLGGGSFDYYAGMPFELRALECALAAATRLLDSEVLDLEREAYPAIDRMAESVSREVLEDVRAAKSTMNRLIGRVQRVKQELEDILGDDADMQDMYLGRRAALEHKDLPPQPSPTAPASPASTGCAFRSYGNLLALQREPAMPPPHKSASVGMLASRAGRGGATASAREPAGPGPAAGGAGRGGGGAAAPGAPESPEAAYDREHVEERRALERVPSSRSLAWQGGKSGGSSKGGGGSRAGGGRGGDSKGGGGRGGDGRGGGGHGELHREGELQGRQGAILRRPSLVVRTVRRVRAPQPGAHERRRKGTGRGHAGGQAAGGGGGRGSDRPPSPHGGGGGDSDSGGDSDAGSESWPEGSGGEGQSGGSVIEETVVEQAAALVDPHDIEEAEDLLEAYFMQVDYLLRRLMLLKERTDDTEDLVNIEMDHRRNELVALDLLVTCITMSFTFVAMVAGIFGMNLFNATWQQSEAAFIWVMVLMSLAAIALLVLVLVYIRKRRLMFISTMPP